MKSKRQLHITSKHTGKMEGMVSLSTSPGANSFCQKMSKSDNNVICEKCYAFRLCKIYPSLEKALARNSEILSSGPLEEVPRVNVAYFRFNSFGELHNEVHLINLITIAMHNKKTTFVLWTKRKDLVNKCKVSIPKNMIMIYSSSKINPRKSTKPPKNFDKLFSVYSKDYVKEKNIDINCGGNKCFDCLKCYDKKSGHDIIREVLK